MKHTQRRSARRYKCSRNSITLSIDARPTVQALVGESLGILLGILATWAVFTYFPFTSPGVTFLKGALVVVVILMAFSMAIRQARMWKVTIDTSQQCLFLNRQPLAQLSEIKALGVTRIEESGKWVWQGFGIVGRLGRFEFIRDPEPEPVAELIQQIHETCTAPIIETIQTGDLPETTYAAGTVERPFEALARKFWLHADATWLLPRDIRVVAPSAAIPKQTKSYLESVQAELADLGFQLMADIVDHTARFDPMAPAAHSRLMVNADHTVLAIISGVPLSRGTRTFTNIVRQALPQHLALWSESKDKHHRITSTNSHRVTDVHLDDYPLQHLPNSDATTLQRAHQEAMSQCESQAWTRYTQVDDYATSQQARMNEIVALRTWEAGYSDEELKVMVKFSSSQREQLKRELIRFGQARKLASQFSVRDHETDQRSAPPLHQTPVIYPRWAKWGAAAITGLVLAILALWFAKPWRSRLTLPSGQVVTYTEKLTGGATEESTGLPIILTLHGLGDHPDSFAALLHDVPFPARLISPTGPAEYLMGTGWYNTANDKTILDGIETSVALMHEFMEAYQDRHSQASKWTLVGFSQGAYIAYGLAVRHPKGIEAVYALSGGIYLDLPDDYRVEHGPPIYAFHGAADDVIPVEWDTWSSEYVQALGGESYLFVDPGSQHGPKRETLHLLKQLLTRHASQP